MGYYDGMNCRREATGEVARFELKRFEVRSAFYGIYSCTRRLRYSRNSQMEISEALVAQQQVVRLQALLEASRQLHSTIELDEVVRVALQIVVLELELTGAFFSSFPHTYGEVSPLLQAFFASERNGAADELLSESLLRF